MQKRRLISTTLAVLVVTVVLVITVTLCTTTQLVAQTDRSDASSGISSEPITSDKFTTVDAMMSTPALICKKCGKESLFRAVKCANPACGAIFFRDSVPNNLFDRCPECKQSETEEIRKKRLAERQ